MLHTADIGSRGFGTRRPRGPKTQTARTSRVLGEVERDSPARQAGRRGFPWASRQADRLGLLSVSKSAGSFSSGWLSAPSGRTHCKCPNHRTPARRTALSARTAARPTKRRTGSKGECRPSFGNNNRQMANQARTRRARLPSSTKRPASSLKIVLTTFTTVLRRRSRKSPSRGIGAPAQVRRRNIPRLNLQATSLLRAKS